VIEVGEAQGIAEKEHRRVVADNVPIAFLGVELDRETANVPLGIGRAALARHGGKAHEEVGLLANLRKSFARVKCVMSPVTVKLP
jgi:hypothetical protein